MIVTCTLCAKEQPHSECEHVAWKCERCGEIVRACKSCADKRGNMTCRVIADGVHKRRCIERHFDDVWRQEAKKAMSYAGQWLESWIRDHERDERGGK